MPKRQMFCRGNLICSAIAFSRRPMAARRHAACRPRRRQDRGPERSPGRDIHR